MLRNAMDVLELFSSERREIGVTEAAALLDRPKSTASRWLAALEDAGFLDAAVHQGRYRLGMRLIGLGQLARSATSLQELARPRLAELAAATGETANLVVLADGVAVNVELVESPRQVKHVGWLGRRLPLHATAAGKALIAWLDPAELAALLEPPLAALTARTMTDPAALAAELARVRERGYAEAWGELEEDLLGLAAPVLDETGRVVGALTISAPLARVPRDAAPRLAEQVRAAAASLTAALGGHAPIYGGVMGGG
jgi:IclR family transcriptional regulator, acetate operon repressor